MKVETYVMGPLQTNTYLLSEGQDVILIDPAGKSEKLIELLGQRNLLAILLTHGHFDHTGGVNDIKKLTDAPVFIHKDDECMLSDGNKALAYFCPTKKFVEKEADFTFGDGDEIVQDGIVFKVMHTPGHSAGSSCFLVEADGENYMFAGDTIFKDSIGRSDGYSGDYIVQKATLEKLKALDRDYIILSGHGEETTLEEEKRYNPFLS